MKKLIYFITLAMAGILFACHSDDGPKTVSELPMMAKDSIALRMIAQGLHTQDEGYPNPWDPRDRSTWGDNIKLDTIVDTETATPFLTVSSIKLYITDSLYRISPMLKDLVNLQELEIHACAGAWFRPKDIPIGCKTFVLDKIDPEEPGRIHISEQGFYLLTIMSYNRWSFSNFIVRGTDSCIMNILFDMTGTIDMSNNLLDSLISSKFFYNATQANLSHNRFSVPNWTWEEALEQTNIPNLQYNELEIPQWVTETEWWKTYHECFIGNPGYIAPAK